MVSRNQRYVAGPSNDSQIRSSTKHHKKSKLQDVLMFEASDHGTFLFLDHAVQATERDEFALVLLLPSNVRMTLTST